MANQTAVATGLLQLLSDLEVAAVMTTMAGLVEAAGIGSYAFLDMSGALICLALLTVTATLYVATRPRPVYLFDFACLKPGDAHKCSREAMIRLMGRTGLFTEDSLVFQRKILERSGLGPSAYVPSSLLSTPINPCMAEARKEATQAVFGVVDELLAKTGVDARDVGVVVVNCSLFNPTPSLSAMLVNRYGMGEGVRTYSLGGMGCSAGLIAIDLARQLLQYFETEKQTFSILRGPKGEATSNFSWLPVFELIPTIDPKKKPPRLSGTPVKTREPGHMGGIQ
uniref:3-ketoacyl-CoA synthase 11 n=1 Tax=Anthurium amnicola TaxID=1678845 RepID=A0A1D1Y9K9_9ARAE